MDSLTQAGFDLLLARLDQDRQQAGLKYELLRRKLVKVFEWRQCSCPEDLADETIDRVARNLSKGEDVHNLAAYCAGTARLIALENLRDRRQEEALGEVARPSMADDAGESELRMECLERCLRELPSAEASLIVEYYHKDKPSRIACRKEIAAQMGIPLNALRIRTHRIRSRLEQCVQTCMKDGVVE